MANRLGRIAVVVAGGLLALPAIARAPEKFLPKVAPAAKPAEEPAPAPAPVPSSTPEPGPPPAPAPAPAPPPMVLQVPAGPPVNSVRCGFENMSIEDREIALLLIGLDFQAMGRFSRTAPQNAVVDRLVDEALARCATPFRWTTSALGAAKGYSHSTLVLEVLRQAIEFGDHTADPIDAYFAKNQATLTAKPELTDAEEESFSAHLKANGWRASERSAIRLARAYLETLVARARQEQAFISATKRPAAKPKRSVRQAKPARRGRT